MFLCISFLKGNHKWDFHQCLHGKIIYPSLSLSLSLLWNLGIVENLEKNCFRTFFFCFVIIHNELFICSSNYHLTCRMLTFVILFFHLWKRNWIMFNDDSWSKIVITYTRRHLLFIIILIPWRFSLLYFSLFSLIHSRWE